ncbi:DUF11 domain-containing protein [Corticibacter populi]|uniref:DUF11 domain-containing protein n=1 Tax=Corticibacter populi TaxID=1550736 RepID=A0A3M6QSD9_9BURK|nr:CshA/CshB family fibrillar adhesin-related protein [Corticibacter populi]RMX05946.1 DUF11 domain-containing protein [Corticibacter populi]RZS30729.1 putative repeat protein (TIGR01451 family) [Corticibacter populi]
MHVASKRHKDHSEFHGNGHVVSWALLLLTGFMAPTAAVNAAAYANGGSGAYRDEILWLTWGGGTLGVHDQNLGNGSSSSATMAVAASLDLAVTCSLANAGTASNSNNLKSYRPGTYALDSLDNLYYYGAGGSGNQLISGIYTANATKSFRINCFATLGGAAYPIPGVVMADAESMAGNGTGDTMEAPREYVQATADGIWNIVEMYRNPGRTYYARKSSSGSGQTIRFGPGGEASPSAPAAVTFLTFNPSAYAGANLEVGVDVSMKGGGNTAVAVGLLVPKADFGDAPASYGSAGHLIPSLTPVADGLASNGVSVDINQSSFQLGSLQPPSTNFLGSVGPDGESAPQYSADATGDNNNGSAGVNEENAWPSAYVLTVSQANQSLVQSVACNGTGSVAGWIDFDRNGTFDADERAQAACTGGAAALQWTLPNDVQPGDSFVRLRYATDVDQIQSPIGVADDGEVEDHQISVVLQTDLSISKSVVPEQATAGSTVTYTIIAKNNGQVAADGALVQDPAVAGLDCNAAVPLCSATGGAGCPSGTISVNDLRGSGLVVNPFPAGGEVTITLACTLESSTGP